MKGRRGKCGKVLTLPHHPPVPGHFLVSVLPFVHHGADFLMDLNAPPQRVPYAKHRTWSERMADRQQGKLSTPVN